MDAIHWISIAWNEVTPYTIQRCFYKAGFRCENEQSKIEDQEILIMSDLGSILQRLHTEIEPGIYLEADRNFSVSMDIYFNLK